LERTVLGSGALYTIKEGFIASEKWQKEEYRDGLCPESTEYGKSRD